MYFIFYTHKLFKIFFLIIDTNNSELRTRYMIINLPTLNLIVTLKKEFLKKRKEKKK